jgi:hypothetical protein
MKPSLRTVKILFLCVIVVGVWELYITIRMASLFDRINQINNSYARDDPRGDSPHIKLGGGQSE